MFDPPLRSDNGQTNFLPRYCLFVKRFFRANAEAPHCPAATRASRACLGLDKMGEGRDEGPGVVIGSAISHMRLHHPLLTEFLDFVFAVTHHLTQDRGGML